MKFEVNSIYHVFNRGNNSQRIFFKKRNYLFFLSKINTYITPFADILAWCLMPNHFHLMIYTKRISIDIAEAKGSDCQYTKSRRINDSISILLRSYTRAINKQETRTGSLFQNRTKAICLSDLPQIWLLPGLTPIVELKLPCTIRAKLIPSNVLTIYT